MKTEIVLEDRFMRLAEILLQIIIEGQEFKIDENFRMPQSVILKTAKALQDGYLRGLFKEDEKGLLYYSGMTEDYGGYYEAILNQTFQEDSITVFKNKLAAFAKACEELDNAWDYVDGNPEVMAALDQDWSFKNDLYYKALAESKKWAEKTAKNLEKNS